MQLNGLSFRYDRYLLKRNVAVSRHQKNLKSVDHFLETSYKRRDAHAFMRLPEQRIFAWASPSSFWCSTK
jgi:hypothetical protein